MKEKKTSTLKNTAVKQAPAIVMSQSFIAIPNTRRECTPFPGSPNKFAKGHGIFLSSFYL
jgi:hypothetical protein